MIFEHLLFLIIDDIEKMIVYSLQSSVALSWSTLTLSIYVITSTPLSLIYTNTEFDYILFESRKFGLAVNTDEFIKKTGTRKSTIIKYN